MDKKWLPIVSMDEGDTYDIVAAFTSEERRDKFFDALNEYYENTRDMKGYVVKRYVRLDPSPDDDDLLRVCIDTNPEKQ